MTKTILITGASSGFGQAMAAHLGARGHRVFGTSRRPAGAQGTARMLALDVTDDASVASCVRAVLEAAGRIDVLVNNAGVGLCGAVEDTSPDEARAQFDTNFFGPVRMIHAVLPAMRAQGEGRIITIGSLAGHAALPFQPYYSASKFALEGLNEALRLELADTCIQSTMICPGDFRTGFTAARVFSAQARAGANAARLERALAIFERDENAGADPALVAELVARLIEAPALRQRYLVGRWDQRFGISLKRVLPAEVFRKLMRNIYKV